MHIETKYGFGDELWGVTDRYANDTRVRSAHSIGKVVGILVDDTDDIRYYAGERQYQSVYECKSYNEYEVFRTRAEASGALSEERTREKSDRAGRAKNKALWNKLIEMGLTEEEVGQICDEAIREEK